MSTSLRRRLMGAVFAACISVGLLTSAPASAEEARPIDTPPLTVEIESVETSIGEGNTEPPTATPTASAASPTPTSAAADPNATAGTQDGANSPSTENRVVTVSGTVTNNSKSNQADLTAFLWVNGTPMTTSKQLEAAMATPQQKTEGERLITDQAQSPVRISSRPSATRPILRPGESASYTVSTNVSELNLSTAGASYQIGIEIAKSPDATTLARGRTWLTNSRFVDAPTTNIVLLTARPSMIASSVYTDDYLIRQLKGRLSSLLEAAELPGTVTVVDPALLDEIDGLTRAFKVIDKSAAVNATTQQLASSWLRRFDAVIDEKPAYRLPYGNPDLRVGLDPATSDVAVSARKALSPENPAAQLPLALLPRDGELSGALLDYAEGLRPRVVFAQNTQNREIRSLRGIKVLPYRDSDLEGVRVDGMQTRQQVLDALRARQIQAANDGDQVTSIISTQQRAQLVDTPVADVEPRTVAQAIEASTTAEKTVKLDPMRDYARGKSVGAILDLDSSVLQLWPEISTDEVGAIRRVNAISSKAFSTSWASTSAAEPWLESAIDAIRVRGSDAVRLQLAEDFVLPSEESTVPLTITNRLYDPIAVKVVFTSENPQRISADETAVFTVDPGDKATFPFHPVAYSNGAVSMTAQLYTESDQPVDEPVFFTAVANSFSNLAWVIIVISGILLIGGTTLRIRQVQRERGRAVAHS